MHKRLEADLVSLAHSILQMKNKDDVTLLHKKAQAIYEKLSVLKFVDEYIETTPNASVTKDEFLDKIENSKVEEKLEEIQPTNDAVAPIDEADILTEQEDKEPISMEISSDNERAERTPLLQTSLEEEFKDAISADIATELFEKATKDKPEIDASVVDKKRSLNDTIFKNNIQVGLNDRIAFVKHLFEGNQEDFNRVLSQLNTFKTEKEAKSFVNKMVKPDYNWDSKEEFSNRLFELIERKFL